MSTKIAFFLDANDAGFPPISVELLNASQLENNAFRLQNSPFFTSDVSYGDIVRAEPTGVAGQYRFIEVIQPSSFTSIALILMDASLDKLLMDLLRGLGCVIEYGEFGAYRVLAVAVPAETDYPALRNTLLSFEAESRLSLADLAVATRLNTA